MRQQNDAMAREGMMKKCRFSVVLATVLTLAAAAIRGSSQENPPRLEAFVQGGPSFFSSAEERLQGVALSVETRSSFGTTGRVFTGVRYYFNSKDAVEASYTYSRNRLQTEATVRISCPPLCPMVPDVNIFFSEPMRVHGLGFNYVRYLREDGPVRPFATGGLGFTIFNPKFNQLETQFAGNFGGGADMRLRDWVSLRVELRDFVVERPSFARKGVTHNIVPSVGFAFKIR